VFFRPTIEGAHLIPTTGPVLIAPVHRSNVDFAFSIFISPRKVFFMAKEGIFWFRPFAALLLRLGAFPVDRDATDRQSMRLAEAVLSRGQALILFPEGTRKDGPTVEGLHDGAMFIAARTHATVIPVGIAGSDRAMPAGTKIPRPARVHVVVGQPLLPPESDGRVPRSVINEKTEELRVALEDVYARARAKEN